MIIHCFRLLLIGLALFFISGCCPLHRLNIQTQYISRESLASYRVGTPDPRLNCPFLGQRLLVQWSLFPKEIASEPLSLHLKVRFRNHEEEEVEISINRKRGTYLYVIDKEKFCQTGGIRTYIAEIRNSQGAIETWKHPLWTDLIQLNIPSS